MPVTPPHSRTTLCALGEHDSCSQGAFRYPPCPCDCHRGDQDTDFYRSLSREALLLKLTHALWQERVFLQALHGEEGAREHASQVLLRQVPGLTFTARDLCQKAIFDEASWDLLRLQAQLKAAVPAAL